MAIFLVAATIVIALLLAILFLYAWGISGPDRNGETHWRTFLDLLEQVKPWGKT